MEDLAVLKADAPKVNYRYLKWSEKSESASNCRRMIEKFMGRAAHEAVPLEYFRFDLRDRVYEVTAGDGEAFNCAMTIIATIQSSAMDNLLSAFDLESAGHLRGTGVSVVFDFPVIWPLDLEPGPSDLLLVVRDGAPTIFTLMQRRIVTPARLEEIRNSSG